jgi:hypothetical protein
MSRVDSLLSRWQKLRAAGQDVTPEALCDGCPELLDEVRPMVEALKRLEWIGYPSETASTETAPPADAPSPPAAPGGALPAGTDAAPPGYEILGELGRGAMGVVYEARQLALNRTVAVKMILAGAHAGPEERRRFLAEAEAVAAIAHPGIVQIHEFGVRNGHSFCTLELCPGGPLAKKLAGAPLLPREAARVVEQVARGVQAAHDKGILHRDLKPGNILLDSAGRPKVADFGLARRLEGGGGLTQSGAVVGTPSYMPPEQALAKKDLGPEADVYALGAILYECLTGRPPFKAATAFDTILQVVNDEPVPPRQLNAAVPAELETVCLKCLRKEPAGRYASAANLAEDLRRYQAGEPVKACPPSAGHRLRRFVRKYRKGLAAAGAFVLVLLAGAIVSALLAVRATRAERLMQAERDRAQLGLTRQVAERIDGELRRMSLAGDALRAAGGFTGELNDRQLEQFMRAVLEKDERIFGLTLGFEPGAYAGKEEYCFYVYRRAGKVTRKELGPPEYDYRNLDWYRRARQEGRDRWGEPYLDVGGGDVWMVSYSSRLLRKGEFVGVVTVDLELAGLSKLLQRWLDDLIPGQKTYGFLVSGEAGHAFISHPAYPVTARTKSLRTAA